MRNKREKKKEKKKKVILCIMRDIRFYLHNFNVFPFASFLLIGSHRYSHVMLKIYSISNEYNVPYTKKKLIL